MLDGFAHQSAPFEEITKAAGVERAANRNPLFQIMLTHYVGEQARGLSLPGITAIPVDGNVSAAKCDIDLNLADTTQGLDGFLTYSTEVLDRVMVDRFVEVFTAVLQAIVTDAQQQISESLLLSAQDRKAVAQWQAGPVIPVPAATLDALVQRQTEQTPDATALVDADGAELTYAQFDARVNSLAAVLVRRGVSVGDRVAVLLPRSSDLVVSLAAVLRAGAAYVPIDPDYPGGRIMAIIEDASPSLLITTPESVVTVATSVLRLDGELEPADAPVLSRSVLESDTAYVIFTSGTTGRPKGVAVSHRAIVNLIAWRQGVFPLEPGDRLLQKSSAGFDVSVPEFFWPLTVGALPV